MKEGIFIEKGPFLTVKGPCKERRGGWSRRVSAGNFVGGGRNILSGDPFTVKKTWWTFRPRKKIFSPPPPNSPMCCRHPPGPSAPPVRETPPLGTFNSPPPPRTADSPFPLPEQKKIKNIRNVHQEAPFSIKMLWQRVSVCDNTGMFQGLFLFFPCRSKNLARLK